MITLLHFPFDPASRTIRIILAEKALSFRPVEMLPWAADRMLYSSNPAGTLPVLIDKSPPGAAAGSCATVSPVMAIIEYLDEAYIDTPMLPGACTGRAETRRMCAWLHEKFDREVNTDTVHERIFRRLMRNGPPDFARFRHGVRALEWHLDYISWLIDRRTWLSGDRFGAADAAGAACISVLDYINIVPWRDFPSLKEWYARIKSRPSVRTVFEDRVDGMPPPPHYEDPDF